jgi:hypothetical protein
MIRNIIISTFLLITYLACGQSTKIEYKSGLTLDKNIKSEVEKHIKTSKEY